MLCDIAKDFLKEADAESLLRYNVTKVDLAIKELQDHQAAVVKVFKRIQALDRQKRQAINEGGIDLEEIEEGYEKELQGELTALSIHHAARVHLKRALMNYYRARLEKIKAIAWQGQFIPESLRELLSAEERESFKQYQNIVSNQSKLAATNVMLDLLPPKSAFTTVEVIANQERVYTISGELSLKKGMTYMLPSDEAQRLVRQGWVSEATLHPVCFYTHILAIKERSSKN